MAVHKVTTFITRSYQGKPQLLLFRHPTAGVQIPAGTVEPGEDWHTAALREAREETGLTRLALQGSLGKIDNELAPDEAVLTQDCQVLSQPDESALPFAYRFSRGVTVTIGEMNGRFRRVIYQEYDRLPNPTAVAMRIDGWLPTEFLSRVKTRHYAHLQCLTETADSWSILSDQNHEFAPFWADLRPRPLVIQPQDRWLDDVYKTLLQRV